MKVKGAKIIVNCLLEQGVKYVFGYPGGAVLDIFDELYQAKDRLTQVLTSHEQGAAHAADGYARVTGKTGVVLATSGPGATNLVTGIANAYMDSVPMVAITGNVAVSLLGRDSFQEVDIAGITMPVTKHSYIVKNIHELADTLREAFLIASSGRPGPVLVDIPKNIQQELCDYVPLSPTPCITEFQATQSGIGKTAELLKKSEKPILYIGGGVIASNATDRLLRFAEAQSIPIASSMMGLGAVPFDHPLYLGMIGMHGHAGVAKALTECDTVIAVGARFSDRVATNREKFGTQKSIIHLDIDLAEIDKNVRSDAHICGDAGQILAHLATLLPPAKHTAWVKACRNYVKASPLKRTSDPLCAREILKSIRALTPDEQIVVTDVGQHQMWTAQSFSFKKPRTFLTSGGLGTMGYGLGAAIGASFALQNNPIVLITGDGSFHMNLNELVTAVKYNLPVKIFLFNNHALGMVRQWQTLFYEGRYSSTTLNLPTDYKKLSEAFGAKSLSLEKDAYIEKTVKAALSTPGPVLVDCRISQDAFVLPMVPAGKTVDMIITDLD